MSPKSLAEAFDLTAAAVVSRGYRFVKDDQWDERFYTFPQLSRETAGIAGALQDLGLRKGDRLALILPDADQFVLSFLAAVRAGVIPVPIYPPTGLGQLSGYVDNTRHIVLKSGARALVTAQLIKPLLGSVQASCPALAHVLTFHDLQQSNRSFAPVHILPEDTAFLQFTSGSTSRPKGVVLTHANLLANIRNIVVEGLRVDPEVDAGLTWLPLFHDMGLIGFVLAPLAHGIQVTFMSPLQFLKRPAQWLQAMTRYRGTITFGPNFAYALCIKRVRDKELEGVDLSAWRVAGCGAEPVRAETLELFADKYAAHGFRKDAFFPAYGLAESTLAVSFARGVPTDSVKASVLWSEDKATSADKGNGDVLRLVCCGKAFEGHQVRVFSLDATSASSPLPDRHVGEIWLRGPSVSPGYFEEPELSAKAFVDGWFRTGDLGYMASGDVYICGRSKEVIIINGRNFYPQDIEWEASQVDGVRKGNVVAFGTGGDGGDREAVVLAFETSLTDAQEHERMVREVRTRVQEVIGVVLDDAVPLAVGVLPKTSSGKLQRTRTRDLYEQGELVTRRSQRETDRIDQVKEIAKSQLGYLKLAVFGGRRQA